MSAMAIAARYTIGKEHNKAVADKGPFKCAELLASEEADISLVIPEPLTSTAGAHDRTVHYGI